MQQEKRQRVEEGGGGRVFMPPGPLGQPELQRRPLRDPWIPPAVAGTLKREQKAHQEYGCGDKQVPFSSPR